MIDPITIIAGVFSIIHGVGGVGSLFKKLMNERKSVSTLEEQVAKAQLQRMKRLHESPTEIRNTHDNAFARLGPIFTQSDGIHPFSGAHYRYRKYRIY
jgi:hypothetical protein